MKRARLLVSIFKNSLPTAQKEAETKKADETIYESKSKSEEGRWTKEAGTTTAW